jgi:hypothetical protein
LRTMMLHLSHDLQCIFILHWCAWKWRHRQNKTKKIWEGLEKVDKTFFQSIGAKKSKIVNKINSKLEVLKREGVKLVFFVK